ncbi:MAG TPA: CHRD domain-containing protein [Blastocatellia bacterium]|nr:CHRD domain-containing protein [Blastocatellia bacterium]
MRKLSVSRFIVIFLATSLLFLASAYGRNNTDSRRTRVKARLSSLNEVPAVITDASGEFEARIEDTQITFELKFENLSANLAASHVHIGQKGVNGGVSMFLCGGGGQPACPAATSGTITGTITAANVVGPAAQGVTAGDFAKAVRAIRAGVTYVNAHDAMFPAGEMRGQLGGFGDDDDDN